MACFAKERTTARVLPDRWRILPKVSPLSVTWAENVEDPRAEDVEEVTEVITDKFIIVCTSIPQQLALHKAMGLFPKECGHAELIAKVLKIWFFKQVPELGECDPKLLENGTLSLRFVERHFAELDDASFESSFTHKWQQTLVGMCGEVQSRLAAIEMPESPHQTYQSCDMDSKAMAEHERNDRAIAQDVALDSVCRLLNSHVIKFEYKAGSIDVLIAGIAGILLGVPVRFWLVLGVAVEAAIVTCFIYRNRKAYYYDRHGCSVCIEESRLECAVL